MTTEIRPRGACYVCGDAQYLEVLRKDSINIWTDTGDDKGLRCRYKCFLNQCAACGHVYQPVAPELRAILGDIYRSQHAQGPSAMGVGNWGRERAKNLFFDAIDLKCYRTAVELGCGDGYILKALKARGFERLIGIEPSSNVEIQSIEGLSFINDFIDDRLRLPEKMDLAYSVAVFEHIEDINGVLSFCKNNLKDDGELFFVVPNAEALLETGDPALFLHQHVHYFTNSTIKHMLAISGFEIGSIVAKQDVFFVRARPGSTSSGKMTDTRRFTQYQEKLDATLERLKSLLVSDRVIVHGACNALNNITGWTEGCFVLVDNDRNKQGKRYFGRAVRALDDLDLTAFDRVVIIPAAYHDQIMADYVARGFRGDIVGIT